MEDQRHIAKKYSVGYPNTLYSLTIEMYSDVISSVHT